MLMIEFIRGVTTGDFTVERLRTTLEKRGSDKRFTGYKNHMKYTTAELQTAYNFLVKHGDKLKFGKVVRSA